MSRHDRRAQRVSAGMFGCTAVLGSGLTDHVMYLVPCRRDHVLRCVPYSPSGTSHLPLLPRLWGRLGLQWPPERWTKARRDGFMQSMTWNSPADIRKGAKQVRKTTPGCEQLSWLVISSTFGGYLPHRLGCCFPVRKEDVKEIQAYGVLIVYDGWDKSDVNCGLQLR